MRKFDEIKNFPFYSFLFYAIDVSPARNLDCEISAQKCQPPFQTITVTPKDSKVTFKCSIKNGVIVPHKKWQYLENHLNASDAGLFLLRNRSQLRECFSIEYASEYVLLFALSVLN